MKDFFRIFVVDDDEEDFLFLRNTLSDLQLKHHMANFKDGKKLLDHLAKYSLTGKTFPDLIVLDINMPLLNGIETLRFLKEDKNYKDIPVIMYSTSSNPDEKQRCLDLGAKAFVTKESNYYKILTFVNSIDNFLRNSILSTDPDFTYK